MPVRVINELIGAHLNPTVVSVSFDTAGVHYGWLDVLITTDLPDSSTLNRELLGLQPTHLGLIDDLDQGHYFHNQERRPWKPQP